MNAKLSGSEDRMAGDRLDLDLKALTEDMWRRRWMEIYPNLVPVPGFNTMMLVLESLAASLAHGDPEALLLRAAKGELCDCPRSINGFVIHRTDCRLARARAVPDPREAAPPGPWRVPSEYEDEAPEWYIPEGKFAVRAHWKQHIVETEAEAIAVRDALNRVAGDSGAPHPEPEA